jgi:hypothetical protein
MNHTHLQPFPLGSRVRVISGRYAGKTGLLLRYFTDRGRGRAWVRSDAHGTEVTFDVDELALLALPQSSDQRSETSIEAGRSPALSPSDQCSEKGSTPSDQCSEKGSTPSDQCSEKDAIAPDTRMDADADLIAHLNAAIALLHTLGTDSGWLDDDRKQTAKTYPRYRWREDGVVRSRALADWEVQPMRDRLRRGRLLRALISYMREGDTFSGR